jgi:stage III sporulation protein AD
MSVFKIVLMGLAAVLLAMQVKQTKPEYGIYISIAVGVFVMAYAASQLTIITEGLQKIAAFISVDMQYLTILFKVIGIAYLCEFASNICKDSGYQSVAGHVELAGKLTILVMSMPIIMSLLDTVQGFLQ